MSISVDQIDLWRQVPKETEVLEFKEASKQYHYPRLLEYCVAIGNEGGGHLILGIRDKIPRMVVGTQAISDPGGMAEKIHNTLGFRVHIEAVSHPDGRVVVLSIPGRPNGSAFHYDGKYLMRVGESLQPMSEDQLRRIFSEKEVDWLLDTATEKIGSARVLELLDTNLFFAMLNLPYPSVGAIIERLLEERFVVQGGGDSYSITRMGALLLAKHLPAFGDLSFKAPRVTVYKGASKLTGPTSDTTGTMGYVVGFQKLLQYTMNRLPHREVITEGLRKNISLVPEIVVRELLANALVHQDFTMHGSSVSIEVFDDRIEISNPGETIVPIDRLINGMRSRNERLADFLRRVGICERRGSGIDKVVDAAESLNLPAPYFRATDQRTLSVAYGPRSFTDMDRTDRIRGCFQHCALRWEVSGRMTNQSLRERFGVPESKTAVVSQVIAAAIDANLIKPDEKVGASKRFARYVPFWA